MGQIWYGINQNLRWILETKIWITKVELEKKFRSASRLFFEKIFKSKPKIFFEKDSNLSRIYSLENWDLSQSYFEKKFRSSWSCFKNIKIGVEIISVRNKFRAELNFRKSLKSVLRPLKNILPFSIFVKCACLSKLSSQILSIVDSSVINDWKGLFVLMCNVKKLYQFWSKKWVILPKKTIFLLNEGIKREGRKGESLWVDRVVILLQIVTVFITDWVW